MKNLISLSDSMDIANDRLLNSAQLAKLLRRSESTLAKWRMRGCGPGFIKLDDAKQAGVLYVLSDVQRWIQGQHRGRKAMKATAKK